MSGADMRLEGKTAIVTGAARGLGQAYAKAISAAGMNVVIAGILEPEDVVAAVLFLAGDTSRFVTGQTIMVDGGTVFL